MSMNRRDLLKTGVFAGAAVALPTARFVGAATANRMPEASLPKPFSLPFKQAPVAVPYRRDASGDYYKIDQVAVQAEIIPGFKSWVFAYKDQMTGVASVPGPTIKCKKGRPAVVRHCNQLPATHPVLGYTPWTSTHLHGSDSAPQYDGYASDITMPPGGVFPSWASPTEQAIATQRGRTPGAVSVLGEFKDYHYPNDQPARTLWYHDHGVHHTAENAYHGMLAQYHLYDDNDQLRLAQSIDPVTKKASAEKGLGLPTTIYEDDVLQPSVVKKGSGEFDVALTIGDLMFQSDGNLLFSLDNQSGHWGDVIHVNGTPWPKMKVKRRKYRFRILTAALSRSFNFSLNPANSPQANFGSTKSFPYSVIGCDGGLAPAPVKVYSHRQLSGERYEIVVDFAEVFKGKPKGTIVELNNLSPKNNINYTNTHKVMAFEVVDDAIDQTLARGNGNNLPAVIDPVSDIMKLTPAMSVATRELRLERSNGAWAVNGTTWDHIIASDFQFVEATPVIDPAKGFVVETWNIVNKSGGWFHPLHIHLVDFKVLSRTNTATGKAMPHECGPKDVVYAGENETISLLVKFNKTGKYMVHCHNLVHEDHDMMTQFEVVGQPDAFGVSGKGDDPMTADPAKAMEFEVDSVL